MRPGGSDAAGPNPWKIPWYNRWSKKQKRRTTVNEQAGHPVILTSWRQARIGHGWTFRSVGWEEFEDATDIECRDPALAKVKVSERPPRRKQFLPLPCSLRQGIIGVLNGKLDFELRLRANSNKLLASSGESKRRTPRLVISFFKPFFYLRWQGM
jgi:hypothetical protein